MFCVECGREGPTTDGLCPTCFAKRHPLLDPPPYVDVPRCRECGALHLREGWVHTDVDLAIPQVLREAVPLRPPFAPASFDHSARAEDASNILLTVRARGRYADLEQSHEFRTRLRLKPSLCDVCTKRRSRYYAGIVQVRAEGRDLTARERRDIRSLVEDRMARRPPGSEEFVSRFEEVRGGLDAYVSTNALAKSLGREVAKAYGGHTTSTSKLYGRRGGKDLHRVTCLVRLPAAPSKG